MSHKRGGTPIAHPCDISEQWDKEEICKLPGREKIFMKWIVKHNDFRFLKGIMSLENNGARPSTLWKKMSSSLELYSQSYYNKIWSRHKNMLKYALWEKLTPCMETTDRYSPPKWGTKPKIKKAQNLIYKGFSAIQKIMNILVQRMTAGRKLGEVQIREMYLRKWTWENTYYS